MALVTALPRWVGGWWALGAGCWLELCVVWSGLRAMPCQDSPPALFPRFLLILIKLERQRRRWGCWMNWQRRRRRNSISQDKGSHQEETTGYGYTYAFCSFCSCSSSSDKLPLNPPKCVCRKGLRVGGVAKGGLPHSIPAYFFQFRFLLISRRGFSLCRHSSANADRDGS